jgi:acetoin utilization deacetylase AcuC-like enzyme
MVIFYDPQCAEYGSSLRPEQPARISKTVPHLQAGHPDWTWRKPGKAEDKDILRAHDTKHLHRLTVAEDFDDDTPYFAGIEAHARRAAGSAIDAASHALRTGEPTFSLMRPPGHHATASEAMGFCYLNSIAIASLHAQHVGGAKRIAIWDFDAHHGNGTEAILRGRDGVLFTSVHQFPGYPGTGTTSFENIQNWPIAPHSPAPTHMKALHAAWECVQAFSPDLVLISAGFDAYRHDPITSMSLETSDFSTLGKWVADAGLPAAAILEGGYSADLPLLIDAFLSAWKK